MHWAQQESRARREQRSISQPFVGRIKFVWCGFGFHFSFGQRALCFPFARFRAAIFTKFNPLTTSDGESDSVGLMPPNVISPLTQFSVFRRKRGLVHSGRADGRIGAPQVRSLFLFSAAAHQTHWDDFPPAGRICARLLQTSDVCSLSITLLGRGAFVGARGPSDSDQTLLIGQFSGPTTPRREWCRSADKSTIECNNYVFWPDETVYHADCGGGGERKTQNASTPLSLSVKMISDFRDIRTCVPWFFQFHSVVIFLLLELLLLQNRCFQFQSNLPPLLLPTCH